MRILSLVGNSGIIQLSILSYLTTCWVIAVIENKITYIGVESFGVSNRSAILDKSAHNYSQSGGRKESCPGHGFFPSSGIAAGSIDGSYILY
jgi:hypothetical protein